MAFFTSLILMTLITVALLVVGYYLKNGIGPVPTSPKVKATVSRLLPEQVHGNIIELGAGWGGMAVMLARRFPKNNVLAVENCPPVWLFCWLRAKLTGLSNLQVCLENIDQQNFEGAGLVYCYLFPGAMTKLERQLKLSGVDVVMISNTFALPESVAEREEGAEDLWCSRIYRYRLQPLVEKI